MGAGIGVQPYHCHPDRSRDLIPRPLNRAHSEASLVSQTTLGYLQRRGEQRVPIYLCRAPAEIASRTAPLLRTVNCKIHRARAIPHTIGMKPTRPAAPSTWPRRNHLSKGILRLPTLRELEIPSTREHRTQQAIGVKVTGDVAGTREISNIGIRRLRASTPGQILRAIAERANKQP